MCAISGFEYAYQLSHQKIGGSVEPPISALSPIRLSDGLNVVKIKNRYKHECCKSCAEATVVKNESTMHFCGYGTNNCAHKSCQDSVTESILSGNWTKSGCKCQSIDICLSRQRPRNIMLCDRTNNAYKDE